ncbi:tripartite tricarboxylate transporter substrate binding protein [Bradyrhizobium sp. LHD-71]|uniref:Bug family tripartite tricarboxylate transporter substrate binding protein n=1 Tax=Bradyrhizobium sp. LHD-71 TaxID=3072141 RepID=UPI00280DD186|nr:tripartite tricarboxylate transporter substrate binding protein [Bradyrhizobium sp. LHD-71]MDQ8732798.1 tripartite tricarboxylate transporter substrate binding protein [Bradyrhizobium sp. LHD-71]
MAIKTAIIRTMIAATTLIGATAAIAQAAETYPSRLVKMIVPASAGGPSDIVARLVADKLGQALGQPVIVENRPGGSLMIGTGAVAKSDPDGYTLLVTTSTPIVTVPFTMKNVPYDVQQDLITVSHLGSTPLVLYVANANPAKSLKDVLEIAKAKPEQANYGSYGTGSSAHILNEHVIKQTGVRMVHIPYKGVAPELQDLVGGQILTAVADIGSAAPLVQGGQIRPVAVTGSRRSTLLADVPTFAEQGVTGLEPFSPWWGVFAPRKTPTAVVDRLSREIQKIVKSPEFNAKMASLGIEPTGLSWDEADRTTRDEMNRWKGIVANLSDIKFE